MFSPRVNGISHTITHLAHDYPVSHTITFVKNRLENENEHKNRTKESILSEMSKRQSCARSRKLPVNRAFFRFSRVQKERRLLCIKISVLIW